MGQAGPEIGVPYGFRGLGVPLTVPIKGSFNGAPLRVVEDTFGSGIEKVYGLGFVAPGWVAFTRFLSSTLLPFLV